MIAVVPDLAACRLVNSGRFLLGGNGGQEGTMGAWVPPGAGPAGQSCQSHSCARSADKEGKSVLIWAGVQSNLRRQRIVERGGRECRHTSDQSFCARRGATRDKKTQRPAGSLEGHLAFFSQMLGAAKWGSNGIAGSTTQNPGSSLHSVIAIMCNFCTVTPHRGPLIFTGSRGYNKRACRPQASIIH